MKARNLQSQDWYAKEVVLAEYQKLKNWVQKDSASHRGVMEIHRQQSDEFKQQTVLAMLKADEAYQESRTYGPKGPGITG